MKLKLEVPVKAAKQEKKYFNSYDALAEWLDPAKMEVVKLDTKVKILIGAKDSGKTIIPASLTIMAMEMDPNASALAGRKYATAAARRLGSAHFKVLSRLRGRGFKFDMEYSQVQQNMYRIEKKTDPKQLAQTVEYFSFENEDGMAGIDLGNGGYFAVGHIEEPSLKGDIGNPITRETWDSMLGVLFDSTERLRRDYLTTNPFHPPLPMSWYITFNDWDTELPPSQDAQRIFPRELFLKMNLGGLEPALLLGNRTLIDKHWENIRLALLKHHTVTRCSYNEGGVVESISVTRMTKLANPQLRTETEIEKVFAGIYAALVTNNSFELARQLGMGYDGADYDTAYNTENLAALQTNTEEYLKGKAILGKMITWDIDITRRITGIAHVIAAELAPNPDPFKATLVPTKLRLVTLPKIIIPAIGKGERGELTELYMKQMARATIEQFRKLPITYNEFGVFIVMDDNGGTYLDGVSKEIERTANETDKIWEWDVVPMKKNGDKHDIPARQKQVQLIMDEDVWVLDNDNVEIVKFLDEVPRDTNKKRIEKGRFEKLADFINACEGFNTVWHQYINFLIDERHLEVINS